MSRFSRFASGLLGGCLLAGLLTGCSRIPPWRSFFGGDCRVEVSVGDGINQNSPVAVELLLVYDQALLKQLSAMKAQDWFQQRDQFLRDHPPGDDYMNWFWVWVPGQPVPRQEVSYEPLIKGGIVFAGYFSNGDHRASFQPFRDIALDLKATDFTLRTLE
jgi:type VI secretion system protein